ncbi:MAG: hypothetical protein AAFX51_18805, partial [Cyanobacteria bacterium J06636_28]
MDLDYTLASELVGTAAGGAALVAALMTNRYGKRQAEQTATIESLESAKAKLSQQLSLAKGQTQTLTEAMALAKDAVTSLEQQVQELKADCDRTTQTLTASESNVSQLQATVTALTTDKQTL